MIIGQVIRKGGERNKFNLFLSLQWFFYIFLIIQHFIFYDPYNGYVIYNYNHNAVPKETLEKVLTYYQFSIEKISDKLVSLFYDDDDDLDDLIGGLED